LTKALSSVPDHPRGHLWLGAVDIWTRRAAEGIAQCEHALALDRNLAHAHSIIGRGKVFFAGLAKLNLGGYEQAIAWFRRTIEANQNYPLPYFQLAAALAQLGRLDEARSAVKAGLALNPTYAISRARAAWTAMSDHPTHLAQIEPILDGMRKAGVPEQ
jgi:tetratricopeptide (TPR) repeat protein